MATRFQCSFQKAKLTKIALAHTCSEIVLFQFQESQYLFLKSELRTEVVQWGLEKLKVFAKKFG